jgi:hypothetical protein
MTPPPRLPVPADWPSLSDEQNLDLRIADLPFSIADSALTARVDDEASARCAGGSGATGIYGLADGADDELSA